MFREEATPAWAGFHALEFRHVFCGERKIGEA